MKTIVSIAAVAAAAAVAPALAQTAPAGHTQMNMAPITRTQMVQKVQQHFAKLDANKDGFVTKAEMTSARSAMREGRKDRVEHRGEAMFDRMDSNNDGSISRSEFDAAHGAMANRKGQHGGMRGHGRMMAGMFAMADANKDGRVSLQEATTAAAAHFNRADANHDGTLSADEMRAAHRAMRGKSGA